MNKSTLYTDVELVSMIREESQRAKALEVLYEQTAESIFKLVRKYGGDKNDAESLASEAIVVLVRSILQDKFRGESKLKVYFIGICKYLWRNEKSNRQKELKRKGDWESEPWVEAHIQEHLIYRERVAQLEHCLSKMDSRCVQIFKWRYYEAPPLSWNEIAQRLGFENAQVARNKGHKCMKKLRSLFFSIQSS